MTAVAPLEIRIFSDLVNKARVVEEYAKTVASSKDTHEGNTSRGRGKYFQLKGQNFKRGGHTPQGQGSFRKNTHDQFQCDKGRGNQSKVSPNLACDRCGRFHPYDSCKIGSGGCFNCGLPSHIVRDCTRGKNLNAVALYDTRASHSFISFDKVEELGFKVSELAFELHVHTPYQTVMTRTGCRQIILGFDWLSKNRVLLDCFELSILFMSKGENGAVIAEGYYLNSVIVHCSGEECQEIEFAIKLLLGAGLVSIAPYRMTLIELDELKTQLEKWWTKL
ncbi:uncharacterized protein LOC127745550 [Arachis duranensis]|uniref:Uncharacterized protein LOC127745550 n=1 Tax=Arachis duranensis TaxID=130453 RepID=A0A9C6THM9_ARADU|nr:uncharacterized protein LOC127745550 [Arachis duranensis]